MATQEDDGAIHDGSHPVPAGRQQSYWKLTARSEDKFFACARHSVVYLASFCTSDLRVVRLLRYSQTKVTRREIRRVNSLFPCRAADFSSNSALAS